MASNNAGILCKVEEAPVSFDLNGIAESLANPNMLANLGAQMVPRQYQSSVGFAIGEAACYLFTEVFGLAVAQGTRFDMQALVLKQIQKDVAEINQKLDRQMQEPLNNAKSYLQHALNYVENEQYDRAYDEFQKIVEKATQAYEYMTALEHKVFCKKLSIYSRLMYNTYNREKHEFQSVSSLPEGMKRAIAADIKMEVDKILQDKSETKIPWSKRLMGEGKEEEEKMQNVVD